MAATFVVAIGATTSRYTTVIKEMSVLFSGQVMIVSNETIVVQAIPLTRGLFPETLAGRIQTDTAQVEKTVPVLFIASMQIEGILQPVPPNFSLGIPIADWTQTLGPILLKDGKGHLPVSESTNEIIVGVSLAEQNGWTTYDEITVSGHRLNITGILDTKLALLSRSVVMSLTLAQDVYGYHNSVNIITAKPANGISQNDLAAIIEHEVSGVSALTEEERNDMIQPVLAQVETWNLGIESVVFVMSLILVMTVTSMSVSERRRDFATLDAMGAPLNYVFRLVIIEAFLIGVIGGIIGIATGSITAIVLASLYTNIPLAQFIPSIFEVAPPPFMLEMFAGILGFCCLGGVIPSINATRTRIAEILRAEY